MTLFHFKYKTLSRGAIPRLLDTSNLNNSDTLARCHRMTLFKFTTNVHGVVCKTYQTEYELVERNSKFILALTSGKKTYFELLSAK